MSYIALELELNAQTLISEMFAEMEARFEGWEPNPGNPEVFLIEALVNRLIVPLAELSGDVADQVFQKFGEQLAGLPPIEASPATVTSTWKLRDTDGHTIQAGTQVDIGAGDSVEGFRVSADVEVPGGASETSAGAVLLEAIEPGSAANNLADPELVDALSWVDSVSLVGETSGGTDAEDPTTYLGRLTEWMQTQAPRPIIARDVAILLRSIAGVQRVAVIDNYNAETEEDEQEKTLSAYPIDADGKPVSEGIREACKTLLESKREANFIFFVEEPTYTGIDVNFQIVVREGYEQAAVEAAVINAIEEALSPANWGIDSNETGKSPARWINETTLRYQDLVTVVNNVEGCQHYTVLKVAKHGSTLETKDVTLTGVATLPEPKTIQVGS